jgi:hypothetical protein
MTFLLVGPAIWMQIRYGGVGAEQDIGAETGAPGAGAAPVMTGLPYGAATGYPSPNDKL